MKILIVDDNEQNLYLLEMMLKGYGYEVVSAENGVEALNKLKKDNFNLIISDILMPKMDGFQLCRECKKDEKLKNIPFIVYTATYTEKKDEEFAMSLGASRFMVKPADPEVFIGMLMEVIKEAEEGLIKTQGTPIIKEPEFRKRYSERVVKKLEKKILQLEDARKALEEENERRKRMEEALLESQEYAIRLIESSSDCIKVLDLEGHLLSMNAGGQKLLEIDDITPYLNRSWVDFWKGKDREGALEAISKAKQGDAGIFYGYWETAKGTPKWWEVIISPIKDADGNINRLLSVSRDITERKQVEEALRRIEWMLTSRKQDREDLKKASTPPYGDLTKLNTARLILDSVGEEVLSNIARDYVDLLETSAAIYEKNGDYALGIFSSSWCQFLDCASRKLCQTDDNREALNSGKWLCHESCWTNASKVAIETGRPVDIVCNGEIHLYAIPVLANGQVVGSINIGYGDLPQELEELQRLAEKYAVDVNELLEKAKSYESRPAFIIELAKERLQSSAKLIGTMIERKWAEEEIRKLNEELEQRVIERTSLLEETNKALGVSEEKYRSVIENIGIGITMISPDMEILSLNKQMREWFPDIDVFGKPICYRAFNDPPRKEPCSYCPTYKTLKDGQVHEAITETPAGDKIINYRVVSSPIKDENGKVVAAIELVDDITERKRREEEIKKLNEDLQHRSLELEAANKELESFCYSVSHDLRAPLRHIIGFVELLKDSATQSLDEQSLHYMNVIWDSTNNMGTLIDDLLSFSRMGRTEMMKTKVNLNQLVKEAKDTLEIEAKGRDIVWNIYPLPEVYGDAGMLRLVFINLISNALKFTKKKEQAQIEIGHTDNEKEFIFFIRDNGAGFDMQYVNKLFNIFQRLHKSEEFEGTGVGLANVRRIINRHGGKVWAEGKVNEGATFYFLLPKEK